MKIDSRFVPFTYGFVGAFTFWALAQGGPAIAQVQGSLPAFLKLQSVSPGTAQTGHANITGTSIAGQFQGGGAGLTGLDAANVTTGTLALARLPVPLHLLGSVNANGVINGTNTNTANLSAGLYGLSSSASGIVFGVFGQTSSPDGSGVFGNSTSLSGGTNGVLGQVNSTSGRGVSGLAFATTGSGVGVFGQSQGSNGLGVYGSATSSSNGIGVLGESAGSTGIAVKGFTSAATGATFGVDGISSSSSGTGVRGLAISSTGTTKGVHGRSASTSGVGVFGEASATSGSTSGVYGTVASVDGNGVFGFAASGAGQTNGVLGQTVSDSGAGVRGQSMASAGYGIGVSGSANGSNGTGVVGVATSGTGITYGVVGQSVSATGYGGYFTGYGTDAVSVQNFGAGRGMIVQAASDTALWAITNAGFTGLDARNNGTGGYAVFGYQTNASGNASAIVGQTTNGVGWGLYAFGNSGASGTKSFRIDHPLDPEHKYLTHYSTESPTPQNFYSGNVRTDSTGRAWVDLPAYFSQINTNFKYQLTVVDGNESPSFVQAKVGRRIANNRFLIMTSSPNTDVSWRVEADRNDKWVQRYGAPTESEKSGAEVGKYQHPELYGKSPAFGVNYTLTERTPPQRGVNRP